MGVGEVSMRFLVALFLLWVMVVPAALRGEPKRTTEAPPVRVMIFMRTECAEGRRFAPEIQRLQARFFNQGVEFLMVFPDPADNEDRIDKYFKSLGYTNNAYLRQDAREAALKAHATVAPEAAVYDHDTLVYLGRIGDTPPASGEKKKDEGAHELQDAIVAAMEHRLPAVAQTAANGCPLW
jgi:hypothetical protein